MLYSKYFLRYDTNLAQQSPESREFTICFLLKKQPSGSKANLRVLELPVCVLFMLLIFVSQKYIYWTELRYDEMSQEGPSDINTKRKKLLKNRLWNATTTGRMRRTHRVEVTTPVREFIIFFFSSTLPFSHLAVSWM